MKHKALVIGESVQSFLCVIRSLGRRGIRVDTASNRLDHPALFSRYIQNRFMLNPYSSGRDEWVKRLNLLLKSGDYDLVIPCHDSTIVPMQANRESLAHLSRITILEPGCFDLISSKLKTWELAKNAGVNVPEQMQVFSIQDLAEARQRFSLPLVLKPETSVTVENIHTRHVVRKIHSRDQLDEVGRSMLATGPFLVQKPFYGTGTGVEFLARHGKILTAFQHLRIHEKIGGGPSCYRKSIPLMPHLLHATRKIIERLDYTGVGMAEFKIHPDTGDWVFLEINGRFWGSLPLAVASGADFPFDLFQMMILDKTDFSSQTYKKGIFCRNLLLDGAWFVESFRQNHFGTRFNHFSLPRFLKEAANIFKGCERWDAITLDDPLPGIMQMKNVGADLIKGTPLHIPWT
ncbi:hypothetical protein [Desulfospira joergensenii]|uniref:carboxylate--amine ligase n=1 Tax=Desulfospira joergensenii TaxID=53329 RepID=UPI0003B7247A|nr:hypothetical protein [Desulfospira joergensenii]